MDSRAETIRESAVTVHVRRGLAGDRTHFGEPEPAAGGFVSSRSYFLAATLAIVACKSDDKSLNPT